MTDRNKKASKTVFAYFTAQWCGVIFRPDELGIYPGFILWEFPPPKFEFPLKTWPKLHIIYYLL